MTKETVYVCDVTGEQLPQNELTSVSVKELKPERGQSNELSLTDSTRRENAEHVSKEEINNVGLQSGEFDKLEIIIVGDEVVGWRDHSQYVATGVQNIETDDELYFLKRLTYL